MTSNFRSCSDGYQNLPSKEERPMIAEKRNHSHSYGSPEPPSAFLTFVRDAHPLLHIFFSSHGASASDTEDLAQDCLERLMRYRRCRAEELSRLLHRIARNRLADFRRSPRAQIERQLASADATLEDYSPCADPVRQASVRQMFNSFCQALSTLPDRPREVYLLNRVVGMSYSQIARHRGVTTNTVEKQISRALQDLRKVFDPGAFCTDENS